MKNALKYFGLIGAQGAVAFALAIFLIGPALRGEPMPWQKKADTSEESDGGGSDDADSDEEETAKGSDHGEKGSKKEKGKKKSGHGEEEIGGLLPIESVIVNVAETQGRRFLKASLTLEVDGAEGIESATARLPILRGAVIEVLASKNLEELVSPDARSQIRSEILETLNSKNEDGGFKDLFFTEFIVQ